MKIAYLVSQYPSVHHTFILREIKTLRSLGWEILVVSIRPPTGVLGAEEREESTFTRVVTRAGISTIGVAHALTIVTRPWGYARGIWTALRLGGSIPGALRHIFYFVEAVVAGHWMIRGEATHFHSHFSSTVALLVSRIFPLSFSMTIHGPEEFDDVRRFALAEKIVRSRFVVTISSYAKSQVLRCSPPEHWSKVVVCRLGVDPSVFFPRPQPEGAVPEMLFVGRLAPVKAQTVLIEATRILVERGREIRLRLVGDGPDRQRLARLVAQSGLKNRVVFDGWQDQSTVRSRLEQATLFTLASFAEGIPVVLMEAMATGVPCVATTIMGIPELIRDGVDGLLVEPANAAALADGVELLLDDRELCERLAESGRKRVMEHYDLKTNTARFAEIMRGYIE